MRAAFLAGVLLVGLSGCDPRIAPGGPGEDAPPLEAAGDGIAAPEAARLPRPFVKAYDGGRFAGTWLIDQPAHATYEASLYELRPDGLLAHLETFSVVDRGPDYRTGSVSRPDGSVRCLFADWWRAPDARTLQLGSRCSDGVAREVVLEFPGPPEGNALSAEVHIATVGGERGWVHRDFDWRFVKCNDDRSNCRFL
ncbi:MAG: hypothetical protein ACK4N5_00655 [Myxococcales bacterium]